MRRSIEHFSHQDQLPQSSGRPEGREEFAGSRGWLRPRRATAVNRRLMHQIVGEGSGHMFGLRDGSGTGFGPADGTGFGPGSGNSPGDGVGQGQGQSSSGSNGSGQGGQGSRR